MTIKPSHWLLLLGLTGGLAAGGYTYQRGQASQATRLAHIKALADQLSANIEQRAEANAATVRGIAHIVCLNHNWGAAQGSHPGWPGQLDCRHPSQPKRPRHHLCNAGAPPNGQPLAPAHAAF